jgi:AraC-type DNA-binding domain-containing proteins
MTERVDRNSAKFHGAEQPEALTIRALQSAELMASHMTWQEAKTGFPVQFERKNGYLMCLQRLDLPAAPHWVDGRAVLRPGIRGGQSLIADLNQEHSAVVQAAVDCVSLYMPREALDRFQEEHERPRLGTLRASPDAVLDDEVIRHLGECLLPALERPDAASRLFIDYVSLALLAHLTASYGGQAALRPPRGALAPWQERRAKEMLLANIDGRIGLDELAAACRLSRSHFARAFKVTTGTTPLQWLLAQRLERAKSLLLKSDLRIDQIAHLCGFADQSHFTRVFLKATKVTPGLWRRLSRL